MVLPASLPLLRPPPPPVGQILSAGARASGARIRGARTTKALQYQPNLILPAVGHGRGPCNHRNLSNLSNLSHLSALPSSLRSASTVHAHDLALHHAYGLPLPSPPPSSVSLAVAPPHLRLGSSVQAPSRFSSRSPPPSLLSAVVSTAVPAQLLPRLRTHSGYILQQTHPP